MRTQLLSLTSDGARRHLPVREPGPVASLPRTLDTRCWASAVGAARPTSSMATNLVDWLDADGDVEHVPPHVKQALEAPWRGQDDLKGAKARATLSFFTEEAVFTPMDQVRRTRTTPNKLTSSKNVGTRYISALSRWAGLAGA